MADEPNTPSRREHARLVVDNPDFLMAMGHSKDWWLAKARRHGYAAGIESGDEHASLLALLDELEPVPGLSSHAPDVVETMNGLARPAADVIEAMKAEHAKAYRMAAGKRRTANGADPQPFAFWRVADIRQLKPPAYVVAGLIPAGAQSVIFAPSGHYKTMTALDLVHAIAYRADFHGLATLRPAPIVYVANEDAYSLARQRLMGLVEHYGTWHERIIIVPCGVSLADPNVVPRLLATMQEAFPGEAAGLVLDTWDRSIGGDPDKAAEVVPAVERVDALLAGGMAFAVTLSHSPWGDQDRTKGAVPYWASQAARIKVEKDPITGRCKLDLVHQKNGPSGLHLEFEYVELTFTVGDDAEPTTTLIPQRIWSAPTTTPPKIAPERKPGKLQAIMLHELRKLSRRHPSGVGESLLKSAFILEVNAARARAGQEPKASRHNSTAFADTLDSLVTAGLVDRLDDDALLPAT